MSATGWESNSSSCRALKVKSSKGVVACDGQSRRTSGGVTEGAVGLAAASEGLGDAGVGRGNRDGLAIGAEGAVRPRPLSRRSRAI